MDIHESVKSFTKLSSKAPEFVPACMKSKPMDVSVHDPLPMQPPGIFSEHVIAPKQPPGCFTSVPMEAVAPPTSQQNDGENRSDDEDDMYNTWQDATRETHSMEHLRKATKKRKMRKRGGRDEPKGCWDLSSDVKEKLMHFIEANELDDEAAKDLVASPPEVIEHVLAKGEVLSARNPSALLSVRINQAWRDLKREGVEPNKKAPQAVIEQKPLHLTGATEDGMAEKEDYKAKLPWRRNLTVESVCTASTSAPSTVSADVSSSDGEVDSMCNMKNERGGSESDTDRVSNKESIHHTLSEEDLDMASRCSTKYLPTESNSSSNESSSETDKTMESHEARKTPAKPWTPSKSTRRSNSEQEEGGEGTLSDEELIRKMKSILNKLTIEKFPRLSEQLATCGIRTPAHLEVLVREIFTKATMQHHFINMYADLCAVLQDHFANNSISGDRNFFKKILLNACQASFEEHLSAPEWQESLKGEDLEEAAMVYKLKMLGNIKLVGALLVRKMLASKVMFAIIETLLKTPKPEAMESLAAFLTIIGPSYDAPESPHQLLLTAVFDQVELRSKSPDTNPRIRFLLKDVLELRACNWQNHKPQKLEGPTTLEEVAETFHTESKPSWSKRGSWSSPSSPQSKPTRTMSKPMCDFSLEERKDKQDRAAYNRLIAEAFACLISSGDVQDAVSRIAAIAVPLSMQAEHFCDLLVFLLEAECDARKVGFEFLATIFVEGHWRHKALEEGFRSFAHRCSKLKFEVPTLPKILCDEIAPAFQELVSRDILASTELEALLAHNCGK
jgi:hypothetical protein